MKVGLRAGTVLRLCWDCVVRVREQRRQVIGCGHIAGSKQRTLTLWCLGRKG